MLRILTYHRVAEPKDTPHLNPRMISATPANFERQMRHLAQNFHVVSMEEVLKAGTKNSPLPPRAVLLTFDDAYCDFGEIAWPILKRFKLPATLFVPTAYPDHPERSFWWDRLHRALMHAAHSELKETPIGVLPLAPSEARMQSLKRLQEYLKTITHAAAMELVDEVCDKLGSKPAAKKNVLSWKELQKLARAGVTLGAHTRTHPIMTQISREEIRREVTGSQADLQREIGHTLPIFCYPSGGHDDTVVDILREENFTIAFATRNGQSRFEAANLLRLRRTNITVRTTLSVFRLRMMPWFVRVDAWRYRLKQTPIPAKTGLHV